MKIEIVLPIRVFRWLREEARRRHKHIGTLISNWIHAGYLGAFARRHFGMRIGSKRQLR
jgi:hypothetical protein